MLTDARLTAALRPLVRRAGIVEFWKYSTLGLVTALVAGQAFRVAGFRSEFVPVALIGGALAFGAVAAARRRPAVIGVARRVDQRAGLHDLVVSAVDARGEGLAALVREDAVAALGRQNPRDIYPLELPDGWKRIAVAVLVAETVLLGLAWQAPAERAANSPLASMTLPASNSVATSKASQPAPRPSETRPAATVTSQPISPGSPNPIGAISAGALDGANSATTAPAGADRVRSARADAENDITAGRVPAAKRAMVERYFAALQAQKKTPR